MTAPMSEDRLAEITAMVEAATDGPWHTAAEAGELGSKYPPDFVANWEGGYLRGVGTVNTGDGDEAEADLRLMLEAPTVIPEVLAEVRRLREALTAKDTNITQAKVITTGNGGFRVRYRQFGQWQRSGRFTTQADAKTWLANRKTRKAEVAS